MTTVFWLLLMLLVLDLAADGLAALGKMKARMDARRIRQENARER